jgi:hypothetical protein
MMEAKCHEKKSTRKQKLENKNIISPNTINITIVFYSSMLLESNLLDELAAGAVHVNGWYTQTSRRGAIAPRDPGPRYCQAHGEKVSRVYVFR